MLARRLTATLFVAALGCGVSLLLGVRDWTGSQSYLLIATALLAVGLFSATHDISIPELSVDLKLVFIAVTFGVVVKAALIAGVMYAIFGDPAYIVLGVAVAQIDPLSVAVMQHRSRMSKRAKAILAAWSSFDDPVTAILAVYLSAVALGLSQSASNGSDDLVGGYSNAGVNVLLNALLVAGAYVAWRILRALGDRDRRGAEPQSWPVWLRVLAVGVLLAAGAIAVGWFLMLGIALAGLFLRPGIDRALGVVTPVAFIIAVLMLGMVLAGGVNLLPGVLLGVAAFTAQVIVGLIITRSLPRDDRRRLSLSQQNGITAIILALLLETVFPGTVAIVGPAILVISVLHMSSNAVLDSIEGLERGRSWATLASQLRFQAVWKLSQVSWKLVANALTPPVKPTPSNPYRQDPLDTRTNDNGNGHENPLLGCPVRTAAQRVAEDAGRRVGGTPQSSPIRMDMATLTDPVVAQSRYVSIRPKSAMISSSNRYYLDL